MPLLASTSPVYAGATRADRIYLGPNLVWSNVFNFYVDSVNGSDANPGTLAAPWQTLTKVNSSTFTAGQRIGLRRGSVWNQELVPPSAGTAAAPIEFAAYGTGNAPLIDGGATITGWSVYTPPTSPQEVLTNGNFETWTDPTSQPNSWGRFQVGTSTTSRVASITGAGLYSLRLTGDASNSNVSISQTVTLVAGTNYTLSFTGRVSAAGKVAGVVISIPSGTYAGYQLQPDGTWSTDSSTSIQLNTTGIATVTRAFTMLPETASVSFGVKRIALASAWAEFDDVSLMSGVPAVPPVNTYQTTVANRVWTLSRDDVAMVEGSSRDTLADGQHKWLQGVLYVRDDSKNPAAHLYQGGSTLAHAVSVIGKPHIRVRDLASRHITGRTFRADNGSHDTVFQRINVRYAGHSDNTGSYAGVLAVRDSDDCQILDCTIYGADSDGVHGWNATRMKVLRNNIGVCNGPTSDSIQIDGGYYYDHTLPRYDLNTEVAYNTCDQRGTNSPKGCIILIHDGSRAHHNTCYGGNFQLSLLGSRVRGDHNKLVDNAPAASWGAAVHEVDDTSFSDVEIDHNLIINPKVGIRVDSAGVAGVYKTNVREHHNTIVLTAASLGGIWHEVGFDGTTLDNIIWGGSTGAVISSTGLAPSGTWVSNRNDLGPERAGFLSASGTVYATLAAWRTATGQDAASVVTDPALDSNYAPTAGLLTAGYLA